MKTSVITVCFVLSLGFSEASKNVVDGDKYMMKVVDRMMELLKTETISISDGGLPVVDIVGNFQQQQSYEITLDGLVTFHSGFVMRIEKFSFGSYAERTDDDQATALSVMTLHNVNFTYDVDSELSEYKARYTVVLWMEALDFNVEVSRVHETGFVYASVKFFNLMGKFKSHVFNFPSNPYTQRIASEFKQDFLRNPLKKTFQSWATVFQKFAVQATNEIKFPEICYTCL